MTFPVSRAVGQGKPLRVPSDPLSQVWFTLSLFLSQNFQYHLDPQRVSLGRWQLHIF